ncbi:MAG: hypothetical protein CVV41_18420 [Candidatus Riflebacteria bacterium HGW-Riflebacteria-1]|jgi:tetratricopeptide (TPR) repeat protein|nr:MAG: hypothetical protein CVV41_18420 [Candidatus Riflebacteria bacterium HGW-Riflebacteria-1]PKL42715.1 MAG: hypothetical protein CVV42_20710 [Candidatus Riflebacteria bacterium HGW-Riflebacteria-2]
MENTDSQNERGPGEEFYTDAHADAGASFEDALLLERFEVAQSQLEDFKSKNGESAIYLYRLARLKQKQKDVRGAYEIYKRLYYELPVFMRDKKELADLQHEFIDARLSKAKAMWNQVVAAASHFLEENPDAQNPKNKEPYVKAFWKKHYEDLEGVATTFCAILEFEQHETNAILGLIQCYTEIDNKEKRAYALELLDNAKKHWKEMAHKRSGSAITAAHKQEESGNFAAVIEIVNLGLETEPANSDLLLMKAEALSKLWHFQEALSCIQVALRQNQNNSKAQRMKKTVEGQIFDQNLKDGLDFLYKAEQEKPGSSHQLKWIESALSCFLDALSFDSQNLTALAGLYRCRIRSGEPLKAQTTLERIRQIDPNYDVYSIFRDKNEQPNSGGGCFVATRVYGETHPDTVFLRRFREEVLRPRLAGRVFISLYSHVGPALAELPGRSPLYRICRLLIDGLTRLLKKIQQR